MSNVKPWETLEQISTAIPEECKENIVVIGSLAAGYAFFKHKESMAVRTKDIDCLLKPFNVAVEKGKEITRKLIDSGWTPSATRDPGTHETPEDELPAVRLYPPNVDPDEEGAWFIELLTEPESAEAKGKNWTRIVVDEGHFGLPSFRYLRITAYKPTEVDYLGIYHARPEMMALANLLEHDTIKPDRMSAAFAGRQIKRSNKDLGRVLAIGFLEQTENEPFDFRIWAYLWKEAITNCFPADVEILINKVGNGLKELLNSEEDMEEAFHTCANGLLSSYEITREMLYEVGERILGDVVEKLQEM